MASGYVPSLDQPTRCYVARSPSLGFSSDPPSVAQSVVALSDPFQRGWDIFGTLFYEPSGTWLPPGRVWTLQLAAVVGGHMVGAWAGHAAAVAATPPGTPIRTVRLRQLPLAIVMVALTTLTIWSLGQDLVITPEQQQDQETASAAAQRPTTAQPW